MPIFPPLPGRIGPDKQVSLPESSRSGPVLGGESPLGDPRLLPVPGLIGSLTPQPLPRRTLDEEPRFPLQVLPNGRIDESQLRLGNVYVAPDGTGWRWQGRRFVSTGATRRSLSTTQISKRITGQGPAAVRIGVDEMQNRADLVSQSRSDLGVPQVDTVGSSDLENPASLNDQTPPPEERMPSAEPDSSTIGEIESDPPLTEEDIQQFFEENPNPSPGRDPTLGKPRISKWQWADSIINGGRKQIDAGRELRLVLRSPTAGMDSFFVTVHPFALNEDGTLMDYMLPAEPTFLGLVPPRPVLKKIQFSGGFSRPQHHDLDAGFDNPHGFRWVVEMPPQMSTHGNSSGHFMDIFTRN